MEGDLLDTRQDVVQAIVEEKAWALTAAIAAFAASWRFSNCTVRAGNHKNKRAIKTRTVEIEIRVFLEYIKPATMALESANRALAVLASSSMVRRAA